jgi:hypothetical protein
VKKLIGLLENALEWLVFQLYIWEVLTLILSPQTTYTFSVISWFLAVPQGKSKEAIALK